MNDENQDRDLQHLFRELRRGEAAQSPAFACVCHRPVRAPGWQKILWRHAVGTALAAMLMILAVTVFRIPTPKPTQVDVSALVASALRTVAELPDEPVSLFNSESPTAFLLSPLATASVLSNSDHL